MKIRVLSDLHLEFYDDPMRAGIFDDIDCDIVVLAGDISTGIRGLEWAADTFAAPIVYVMGNHEYYGHDAAALLPRARECAADWGIHLLERDEITLEGMRFLGCTLWSGFEAGPLDAAFAAEVAHALAMDFRMIRDNNRLVTPSTLIEWYRRSRAWLETRLDPRRPAVVITHFAPTLKTVHPAFGADAELTRYFHNNLDSLMGAAAPIWIYGHNHYSATDIVETARGDTLVASNQLGYPGEEAGFRQDYVLRR